MRKLWVFMLVLLVLSGLEGLSRGDEWGGGSGERRRATRSGTARNSLS